MACGPCNWRRPGPVKVKRVPISDVVEPRAHSHTPECVLDGDCPEWRKADADRDEEISI